MRLDAEKIKLIQQYFTTQPVVEAYIFGSYSRGEADNSSDLDILIKLDYNQKIGLGFIQMKNDLSSLLNRDVDLVSTGGMSPHLRPFIEKDMELIYAR